MPVKFRPSQTTRDKASGKNKTQHFYMKSTPVKELQEALDKSSTAPKLKQKIRNELFKRNYIKD
jgi:hypothetical protein